MSDQIANQFVNHLQFLGYEVAADETSIRATHAAKLSFSMSNIRSSGTIITSFISSADNAKEDYLGFVGWINDLNATARMLRYYVDEDADLVIEAFYIWEYRRANFGLFLEIWDMELKRLLDDEAVEEYLN